MILAQAMEAAGLSKIKNSRYFQAFRYSDPQKKGKSRAKGAVAYPVRMSDPVRAYLRTQSGLTRQGRLKLVANILDLLRDHGDALRTDPSRRLASGSSYFRFDYLFLDAGRPCRVDCIADDSAAAFGVLDLVYLDCQVGTRFLLRRHNSRQLAQVEVAAR